MRSLGIDIGSYSVKFAELEYDVRRPKLIRVEEFTLSQDPNKDRSIEVLDLLRRQLSTIDPGTKIVLSEKQSRVSLGLKSFPFKERHKILKSLPFELEDDIPFSVDDAIFDLKVVQYNKSTTDVLALATPFANVQEFDQFTKDVGVSADLLSVEGLALCNLFEDWVLNPPEKLELTEELPDREPAEAILSIGHQSSLLLVRKQDRVHAIRHIDWGLKSVAEHLSIKYSISLLEAQKELKVKGFILLKNDDATQEQLKLSHHIKEAVEILGQQIKLCIWEIESDLNIEVKYGFLLGGGSLLKNIGGYLTQLLEISFNRLSYKDEFLSDSSSLTPEAESRAALAIALAIEAFKKPRNPAINLFKGEFEKKSQNFDRVWKIWKHSAQIAASVFFLVFVWGWIREDLARQLSDDSYAVLKQQAANVAGLTGLKASETNIKRFLREQKQLDKNRALAENVKKLNSALDVLKEISQKLPSSKSVRLDVKRLQLNNDLLEIEGLLGSPREIEVMKKSLEIVAVGGKVSNLKPTLKPEAGRTVFAFRLRVLRQGGI